MQNAQGYLCTKWWKGQTVVVRAVGDASDRASVAFLPDCELGDQALPLIAHERVRLFHQRFSGTEGKVRTISHMLRWLHDLAPTLLYNRRLQYQTDSQAARFCVLGMKGANGCLEAVAEVYRLCAVTDTEIRSCGGLVRRPCSGEQTHSANTRTTRSGSSTPGCTSRSWPSRS